MGPLQVSVCSPICAFGYPIFLCLIGLAIPYCNPDRSYCICGPSMKGIENDDFYETKSSFGLQVVQEAKRRPLATRLTGKAVLAVASTDSAGCHRDSILSLASVKLNQRLLLSSSRDGTIKVWK